jgi:hypothetical protein
MIVMTRTVKYVVLAVVAVPAIAVVAGLAWLGTLSIAYSYKLGWVEVPVHYQLTFGVGLGGVPYTSSTVAQVTYQEIPTWQIINNPGITALYRGQAGLLKLPNGKMVCLLLSAQYMVVGKYLTVAAIADRLLSVKGSPTGPKKNWPLITAANALTVAGNSDIPTELIPTMIVFDDPAKPSSAHLFDPEHPELTLGPQARFLGAQIAVTHDPVTHDVEAVLPWLADPAVPQMLPGDALVQGNRRKPLYKAYFY